MLKIWHLARSVLVLDKLLGTLPVQDPLLNLFCRQDVRVHRVTDFDIDLPTLQMHWRRPFGQEASGGHQRLLFRSF